MREGAQFDPISREGLLVINILLLSVILGIVLIGTLYPIVAQAFGQQVSVGAPYFNATAGSVALLLMFVMSFGPVTRWRRDQARLVIKRLAFPGLVLIMSITALLIFVPGIAILPKLGLFLAGALGIASLVPLGKRNLRRVPLFTWGMVMAHLGVAVSLGGMASEAAFTRETLVAIQVGETSRVGPYAVRLEEIRPVAGPNWTALAATMKARRGDGAADVLIPQARMFAEPPTETSESALLTRWDGQLYAVLGKQDESGRWQVRLWWKPFVTLIWFGGALIALGGFLSLVGHLRREALAQRRKDAA